MPHVVAWLVISSVTGLKGRNFSFLISSYYTKDILGYNVISKEIDMEAYMQHGPSWMAMMIVFFVLCGIAWLGGEILAKWHQAYAVKKLRRAYWLVTGLMVGVLIFSRWLRPSDGFPGEWFRYFIYAAYIWLTGIIFMLVLLLAGYLVRRLAAKLTKLRISRETKVQTAKLQPGQSGGEGLTRRQFLQGAVAAVPAVPFVFSGYGVIGGDNTIVINKYDLLFPQLPASLNGFTIAQISDTHMGPFFGMDKLARVLAMVKQGKPQLLAITGDLVDDLELLSPTMERLTAFQAELPYGIYFCWGNHEYFRDINRIRTALAHSPLTVLENSHKAVADGLYLAGVDYPWGKDKAEQEDKRRNYFSQAMSGIPSEGFPVLLTHHPDFFDNAFAAGVPLSIAGHTHGGQVVIAGTSLLPVKYKYMKGMYANNNCRGYVSAGTGHWLPLRIGCPAEVSFFTLRQGLV
jgi:predicted MPP superfamily phosphohydrolase